jgi:uncharacterized alkaline shock family protein YloU
MAAKGAAKALKEPVRRALSSTRERGRVEVFPGAVAAVAGHAASGCYGVMGLSARGLRDGVAQLLRRDNAHRGVDVHDLGGALAIDVYVVVQYGTRITEVASNLKQAVRYSVERMFGVPVAEVNVNVNGVHEDSDKV